MPRKFVIGDIHGAYKALIQCLQQPPFDYKKDTLICMGDACDGWPESYEVIEELQKIKNLIFLMGNHDMWAYQWFTTGAVPFIWTSQGGGATIDSYRNGIPKSHIEFYEKAVFYYLDNNSVFVHGGLDINRLLEEQEEEIFIWDRDLVNRAMVNMRYGKDVKLTKFDEVYVGHTPTISFGTALPIQAGELWMMDTGAGWSRGVLTLMDVDTKEYYQSDRVDELYPGFYGRG